jgi:rhomboid protease GluP
MDDPAATPYVTWAISVLNVGWFLFAQSHGDTRDASILLLFGATERRRIWAGESWRLLTSCFLHIGWVHLLMNTYFMFGWCSYVEQELGPLRFALAYLLTGIGASAISVIGHTVIGAGASGSGFGMIGIVLMIAYRKLGGWEPFFANESVQSILRNTAIWVVLGIFLIRMDNFAHLGGLVFGLLIGYAMTPPEDASDAGRLIPYALAVGLWIAVVLMSLNPRFVRRDQDPDGPLV